jgi:hypothetical protein
MGESGGTEMTGDDPGAGSQYGGDDGSYRDDGRGNG